MLSAFKATLRNFLKPRAFDYFLCPGMGNLTGKAFSGMGNLTLPGWGGEN